MNRTKVVSCLLGITMLAMGCTSTGSGPSTPPVTEPSTTEPAAASAFDHLREFVDASFLDLVAREPELVTALGLDNVLGSVPEHLDDLSADYLDETSRLVARTLEELRDFPIDSLSPEQEITYRSYEWNLNTMLDARAFHVLDWPVHFLLNSYNQELIGLFTQVHPLTDEPRIQGFISRIEEVPLQVDQVIESMQESEEAGVLPPRYVIDVTIGQLDADIAGGSPRDMEIFRSFTSRIGLLGLADRVRRSYENKLEQVLTEAFIPAWRKLIAHLDGVKERAGSDVSISRFPGGDEYYDYLLRSQTSTDLSADEIHSIGWEQAERVKAEMAELASAEGISKTSIPQLRQLAREELGLVSGDSILPAYEHLVEEAYVEFAPFFDRAPTTPLQVVNDPGPVAYYLLPAADGSRPGSFHAGTGGAAVPRYTMRSLTYHEAVPGHHFQIALAQEADLPLPQKLLTNTGQVEGWALYAERLASDIGLYEGDWASDFGRLDYELLRAARLVVDTGIHHLGWSREEALQTMSEIIEGDDFNHEVDRYVLYPGQATAYMTGMLAILEMRAAADTDVAEPASLAEFHNRIIGYGNVPLVVLREGFGLGS